MIAKFVHQYIVFHFTARKRSLGQGNIFSSVCQEFCPWGGSASVHAGIPPPDKETPPGKEIPLARRPPCQDIPPPPRQTPLHSACWEIRSTSGRYASYWNAILLHLLYNIFSLKIITLREIRHRFCVTKDVPCARVGYLFAVAFLVAPTPKSGATYLLTSVSLRLLGFRQSAVIVSQVVLYCFDKGANISPLQTKLTSSGPSERPH